MRYPKPHVKFGETLKRMYEQSLDLNEEWRKALKYLPKEGKIIAL